MTNKQIIDLTKCIHFDKSDIPNGCTCYWDGECNHDCYYKKYTYKEQECKELKEKYLELKEQNGSYIAQLNTANEQLDQLKAENYALKKQVDITKMFLDACNNSCEHYIQTLIEIEDIAENVQSFVGRINIEDDVYEQMEQILQKISECEGNNE